MSPQVARSFSFLCWPDQVVWGGRGARRQSHAGEASGSCQPIHPERLRQDPHSDGQVGKRACAGRSRASVGCTGLCASSHKASASQRCCELRLPPVKGGDTLPALPEGTLLEGSETSKW